MKILRSFAVAGLLLFLSACTVSICYRGACVVVANKSAGDIASLVGAADPTSVDFSSFVLKPQTVYSGIKITPPSSATLSTKLSYSNGTSESRSFSLSYSSTAGGYVLTDSSTFSDWYTDSYSKQATIAEVNTDIIGLENSGLQTMVLLNGKDVITTIDVN